MRLSVVIPVRDGGGELDACLAGLRRSALPPDEIIVVDDCSSDGSADLARQHGAHVIGLEGHPQGPAHARNRGAEAATGDVLLFVDADVVVHPDTLARIERILAEHADVAAVFGSYDDNPPARGLVTQYKNLLHHYVHQHGRREAATFWAGCGAIRRQVFADLGGFDESYARPSIEDIELGVRLSQAGHRIWLCPEIQVTHLKRWRLNSLLRSDICDRALPWTRLTLRQRHLPADLNLGWSSRWSAAAAWLAVVCLGWAAWTGSPWALAGLVLGLAAVAALNRGLYGLFARHDGRLFALGAAGLHLLYLLYSSLVFGLVAVPSWLSRYGLALLMLATLFKGLAWSVIVPPWHAPDENWHFLYAQSIARRGSWQVAPDRWITEEARRLSGLAQVDSVRWTSDPIDLSDRAAIAARIAELDSEQVKRSYVFADGGGYRHMRQMTAFHPPLYYLIQAAVQWTLESRSILVRVLAGRWISVALGLAVVALAYAAGRELWPGRPGRALLLATLVGFQPMLTFSTATIGNGVLEIALFSAFLWLSLRVIKGGLTLRRAVWLGLLVGLGLLTKISFLSAVPLLGLLWLWDVLRRRKARGVRRGPWLLVLAIPIVLAGWWYWGAIASGGDTLLGAFGEVADRPSVRLIPYLLHYGWVTIYGAQLHMFWGDFGWLDTPLPATVLALLTWLTVIAAWTAGWWLVRRAAAARGRRGWSVGLVAIVYLGCATISLVAFYTYLDFRVAQGLGGSFGIQGRYFLAAVLGQMVWLLVGLVQPAPVSLRPAWGWLVGTGMVGLNLYSLFGTILPRYYAPGDPFALLERAAVLQPVTYWVILLICGLLLISTAGLLLALIGVLMTRGEELALAGQPDR